MKQNNASISVIKCYGYSHFGVGSNPGKTVAIIVGVTAGVAFLIIMVLFIRGLKKKDDGNVKQTLSIC